MKGGNIMLKAVIFAVIVLVASANAQCRTVQICTPGYPCYDQTICSQ